MAQAQAQATTRGAAKVAKSDYFASHGDEHPPARAIAETRLAQKD